MAGAHRFLFAIVVVIGSAVVGLAPVGAAAQPSGPPSWVTAGTRLTYYAAVAAVGAGSYELIEDPNGPLVDPATGKHYRESFTAGVPTEGGTGSGDGYDQVTVMAVDGDDVVISRTSIANEPLTGTRSISSVTAEKVAGASVPGAWIHPDTLAAMRSGAELGRVLVLRGDVPVNGKTYQAVIMVDPTAGAYSFFAYDSVTGVQLVAALRMATEPGGPLQMGFWELREVRQLTIPGFGAAVPDWVAGRPTLSYAGSQQFVNPMSPTNVTTSQVAWSTVFSDVGPAWAMYQSTGAVTSMGVNFPISSTGATAGTGPYWWDPTALGAMTVGQVLDTDPSTGMTMTVSAVQQLGASHVVTIANTMVGMEASATFDVATGVMLGQRVAVQSSGYTTEVQLQAMPAATP